MTMQGQPLPGDAREGSELRVHAVGSIGQVPAAEWDACANPAPYSANAAEAQRIDQENVYNPFISHDFLSALEESGSVGGRSGWQPQHLIAKTAGGAPVATAPCYVKSHSRGEYVFDRGWAEAYERAGGDYYPKLQVAVPFTPATGRRLLVKPGPHADVARQALASGLIEL
jgi:predicted N-acyltransferase